ncbi:hypothetical protein QEN41_16370 [Gordonia alkanivorans]|uniref:hypothetical protein n=1 Tax=Gordonia alkanivorans TaxID=84096 RepID=UPI00244856F1|nr:hypothetical protein [Gordonia alkanivorans]MDH3021558.1 hypothetical protein [Gordonia alkanivorans]
MSIPPEIKAANRRRALEIAAQAPATSSPAFVHLMRTVILPAYREVLEKQAAAERRTDEQGDATDT